LNAALIADDAGEDTGEIDGSEIGGDGGRITCHSCQDWADHAHHPLTWDRIPISVYRLQQILHPRVHPAAAVAAYASTGQPAGGTGSTSTTPSQLTNPQTDQDDQEDGMTTDTHRDADTMTITSGSGGASVQGGTRMGLQLTAIGDLHAEISQMHTYAETGAQMLQELEDWARGLPDQLAGADWSTEAVQQAAIAVAEARTVKDLRDQITTLMDAAADAQQLGDQLAAGGARKGVSGLRPQ
jgi:hypothetical protein